MSEISSDQRLGPVRDLRADELSVIRKMISRSGLEQNFEEQLVGIKVQDLPDGGMGSVRFVQEPPEQRIFGEQIAEGLFHDADGVPVSVALNVDQFDDLFELDLWKVDFSPLIRYPDADEVEIIERHGKLGFPPDGVEQDGIGSKREG